jgi:putative transposase
MDLRHGRTCVFAMHVHLVFVTKYRRKVFTQQVMRELKLIFTSVCKDFEATLIEFNDIGETARFISVLKGPSFLASSG